VLLFLMVLVGGLVGALTSSSGSNSSSTFVATSTAVSRTDTAALMAGSAGNNGSGTMQLGAAAFTRSGYAASQATTPPNSTARCAFAPSQDLVVVLSVAGIICPVAAPQFVLAGQPDSTAGTATNAPSAAPTIPDCQVDCGVTPWNTTAPAVAPQQVVQCPSYAVLLAKSWGRMPSAHKLAYRVADSSEANSTMLQAPLVNLTWQQQQQTSLMRPAAIQMLQAASADNADKGNQEGCRCLSPSEEEAVRVVGLLGSVASQVRVDLAGGGHGGCHITAQCCADLAQSSTHEDMTRH
jgi:hypothetical protein